MQSTLKQQLARLERLKVAGAISDDDYQLALKERQGKVLTQNGYLAHKRKRDGIAASELVSREHSTGTQQRFPAASKRDEMLVIRDEAIKLDREVSKIIGRRTMVKVIKRSSTAMELAMVAAGVTE